MPALLATIHAVGLLTCFALLGSSRIGACIRFLSLQGILFSLVPVIAHDDGLSLRVVLLAGANVALKGMIFPAVLLWLRSRANFHRRSSRLSASSHRSCSGSWLWPCRWRWRSNSSRR